MSGKKRIIIQPHGRMANQMLQLMLAIELRNRTSPDVEIVGYDLPEWGLSSPADEAPDGDRHVFLDGHRFDLDKIACALRIGLVDTAIIGGWGMRLEYHRDPAPYAKLFRAGDAPFHMVGDDEMVIHVRGEDVLTGHHRSYFPLPMSYYDYLLKSTGLRPVFVGQLDENFYTRLLRTRFPGARFLPPSSSVTDFETIRNARHAALGVSSFSWLAAWISSSLENIHVPVCGIFNPNHSDAMLLPVDDERYAFHDVPFPSMHSRKLLNYAEYLDADHPVRPLAKADVAELCRYELLPATRPVPKFTMVMGRDRQSTPDPDRGNGA